MPYNLDQIFRDATRAREETQGSAVDMDTAGDHVGGGSGAGVRTGGGSAQAQRVGRRGVRKRSAVVDRDYFESTCKGCLSADNPLLLDTKNSQLVCQFCGFVDPNPVQCEWDNASQCLLLGGRRMRRKTVPYNHTYYFSEKMRCANGEGMPPARSAHPGGTRRGGSWGVGQAIFVTAEKN